MTTPGASPARGRLRRVVLAVAVAGALAGCSDEALPTRTTELPRGATQSAQAYLNDSAAATQAIRDFSAVLASAGDAITPAEARRMADALGVQARQARALCNRLGAQRLDDQRLEAQRAAVVGPLARVCTSMEAIARLAGDGNVRVMTERITDLNAGLAEVRRAGEP
ncbi:MAG: hypothetical protein KDC33_00010 [Thermoleophilia bacterium]|nr:hypothetical protein [Thermoleophilia bacterium]